MLNEAKHETGKAKGRGVLSTNKMMVVGNTTNNSNNNKRSL
jgi:hypothetical protein